MKFIIDAIKKYDQVDSVGIWELPDGTQQHSGPWIEIVDNGKYYIVRSGTYAICSQARQFEYSKKAEALDFYYHHKSIIEQMRAPKTLGKYEYPKVGIGYENYKE